MQELFEPPKQWRRQRVGEGGQRRGGGQRGMVVKELLQISPHTILVNSVMRIMDVLPKLSTPLIKGCTLKI